MTVMDTSVELHLAQAISLKNYLRVYTGRRASAIIVISSLDTRSKQRLILLRRCSIKLLQKLSTVFSCQFDCGISEQGGDAPYGTLKTLNCALLSLAVHSQLTVSRSSTLTHTPFALKHARFTQGTHVLTINTDARIAVCVVEQ